MRIVQTGSGSGSAGAATSSDGLPLLSMRELKRRHLLGVLRATRGNVARASEILGIDRRSVYRMAKKFGVSVAECRLGSDLLRK